MTQEREARCVHGVLIDACCLACLYTAVMTAYVYRRHQKEKRDETTLPTPRARHDQVV